MIRKKFVILILIISLLGSLSTYKAYAGDVFIAALQYAKKIAARVAAQAAFRAVSNRIIEKVRTSGIDGGPAFVQNWRKFQLDAQYRGEDIWRGLLYVAANGEGDIPPLLCKHIRESTAFNSLQPTQANNLIQGLGPYRRGENLPEYLVATKCDPVVDENFDVFMNDFSAGGGWNTFERLLQPQNNIYGAVGLALDELGKQRELEEKTSVNQALSGQGFTGSQDCLVRGVNNQCLVAGNIKTPGSILKDSISSVFDTSLKFYTTADEASIAIASLVDFIVNKILDSLAGGGGGGSTAISSVDSYKNEFCTAKDDMSGQAKDYIKANYPQAYADFPPRVGKSYCERYISDNNPYPFERCVNACFKAVGLLPDVSTPPFTETPPPGGGGGGGGTCSDKGGTPNYAGNLQTALDAVITANPGGIADQPYTTDNGRTFLNLVAEELQSAGFNATTSVLNGNGKLNPSGDLIGIWRSGDSTLERYDALIANRGAIRNSATSGQFTGDIPLSCVQ